MINETDLLKLAELSGLLPLEKKEITEDILKMTKMIDKILSCELSNYPRWEGLKGKKLLKLDIVNPQEVVLLNKDPYGYVKGIKEQNE